MMGGKIQPVSRGCFPAALGKCCRGALALQTNPLQLQGLEGDWPERFTQQGAGAKETVGTDEVWLGQGRVTQTLHVLFCILFLLSLAGGASIFAPLIRVSPITQLGQVPFPLKAVLTPGQHRLLPPSTRSEVCVCCPGLAQLTGSLVVPWKRVSWVESFLPFDLRLISSVHKPGREDNRYQEVAKWLGIVGGR